MKFGSLAAVVIAMFALATPASADVGAQATYTWVNRWTRGCLDHNFQSGVYGEMCNKGQHQDWTTKHYSDGTVRFMNVATRMCLDVSPEGVRGFGCNDLPYQRFRIGDWGGGYYELVNQWNKHCLKIESGVRTSWCSGATNQMWFIES